MAFGDRLKLIRERIAQARERGESNPRDLWDIIGEIVEFLHDEEPEPEPSAEPEPTGPDPSSSGERLI